MMKKLYLFVLIWISLFCNLSAQEISFRTVSVDNGLSSNVIRKIYKDKRGFIWIGTLKGINRFDGMSIKSFMPNETIYDIFETSDDFLWIASDHGLWKFFHDHEQYEPVHLYPDCRVYCLAESNNKILIGTSVGIFILSDEKKFHVSLNEIIPDNAIIDVYDIYPDGADFYWIATSRGLLSCRFINEGIDLKRYDETAYKGIEKTGAYLYLASSSTWLNRFDTRSGQFSEFIDVGKSNILFISGDSGDFLWVGTDGSGLKKISVSRQEIIESYTHQIQNSSTIASNAVYSFLEDNETLWVGTYSAGLSYSINRSFHVYSHENFSTRNIHIRSLYLDGKEKFLGTRDGFIYINEKERLVKTIHINQPDGNQLSSNTITSIFPYNRRYLLGTINGLCVFDPSTQSVKEFDPDPIFGSGGFYDFSIDKYSNLWMASFKGVICYASGKIKKRFITSNSLLNENIVHSIMADSKDRIWIGTRQGVCYYDHHTDSIHRASVLPEEINLCKITHIYEDRNANIWFCTETDGLYTVDSGLSTFDHYSVEHSLPDKSISSIMEDRSGFFWIATHKGLARCTFTGTQCNSFWLSDGLPGLTFNPGACFYNRSEDRLWWGNESGLVYCNPGDINVSILNHQIQITHFYINGKEVISVPPSEKKIDRSDRIKLSASQNSFGFNFTALNFIYPNDNTFETLLDGYDSDWKISERGQTSVYYGDIKPGKYIFRVRLAGNPESERYINIVIIQSWHFLLWLLPFLFLFFLWGWYWKKVKVLIRKQKIQAKRKGNKKNIIIKDDQQKLQMILKLMEEQKPYLDPDFKISYLAATFKCTSNELSQLINSSLQQSFSDFVNQYRVKEFKRKVAQHEYEKYTIIALSEQCGFNSRSSFFRIFKNITGMTPQEYLKKMEKVEIGM